MSHSFSFSDADLHQIGTFRITPRSMELAVRDSAVTVANMRAYVALLSPAHSPLDKLELLRAVVRASTDATVSRDTVASKACVFFETLQGEDVTRVALFLVLVYGARAFRAPYALEWLERIRTLAEALIAKMDYTADLSYASIVAYEMGEDAQLQADAIAHTRDLARTWGAFVAMQQTRIRAVQELTRAQERLEHHLRD